MTMVDLQVRDISDELYQRLSWLAEKRNATISSMILDVVEREIQREEWWEHWKTLPKHTREIDSVALLKEAREENERITGIDVKSKIGREIDQAYVNLCCNGNHGCNQCGESMSMISSTHFAQP